MIATLRQRARSLAAGGNRKLEIALATLRELKSKHGAIEGFYKAALDLATSYKTRVADAEAVYKNALVRRDLPAVKEALEKLLLSRLFIEGSQHEVSNLVNLQRGTALAVFLRENPTARQTLLNAARGLLEQAERKAATVLHEEMERLPDWDGDAISHSPKIRAADATVDRLTSIVHRIESQPIESVWNLAQQLLDE